MNSSIVRLYAEIDKHFYVPYNILQELKSVSITCVCIIIVFFCSVSDRASYLAENGKHVDNVCMYISLHLYK